MTNGRLVLFERSRSIFIFQAQGLSSFWGSVLMNLMSLESFHFSKSSSFVVLFSLKESRSL